MHGLFFVQCFGYLQLIKAKKRVKLQQRKIETTSACENKEKILLFVLTKVYKDAWFCVWLHAKIKKKNHLTYTQHPIGCIIINKIICR